VTAERQAGHYLPAGVGRLKRNSTQPKGAFMMNHNNGWMDGSWAGGGMWLWTLIGILIVVLLVVLINKVSRK
jgi:hypothetical protein